MSQCRDRRCVEYAAGAGALSRTALCTGRFQFNRDNIVIVLMDLRQFVDHLLFRCTAGAADTFLQAGRFRGGLDLGEPVVPPVSRCSGSALRVSVAAFAAGIGCDPVCRTGGGSRHRGCIGMRAGGIA